jgi:hypothetical protein
MKPFLAEAISTLIIEGFIPFLVQISLRPKKSPNLATSSQQPTNSSNEIFFQQHNNNNPLIIRPQQQQQSNNTNINSNESKLLLKYDMLQNEISLFTQTSTSQEKSFAELFARTKRVCCMLGLTKNLGIFMCVYSVFYIVYY